MSRLAQRQRSRIRRMMGSVAVAGGSTPSFVQSQQGIRSGEIGTATTTSCEAVATWTSGSTLIMFLAFKKDAGAVSVADPGSNTWEVVEDVSGPGASDQRFLCFVAKNITGFSTGPGSGIVVTHPATERSGFDVLEFADGDPTAPVESSATSNGTASGATIDAGTVASVSQRLFVGGVCTIGSTSGGGINHVDDDTYTLSRELDITEAFGDWTTVSTYYGTPNSTSPSTDVTFFDVDTGLESFPFLTIGLVLKGPI